MSELKDPAIKLFGKTIPLLETTPPPIASVSAGPPPPSDPPFEDLPSSPPRDEKVTADGDDEEPDKESSNTGQTDTKQEDGPQPITSEEIVELTNGVANENCKTPSGNSDAGTSKASKAEEEQSETSNSQDKTLKKPDKILPCPRCNSMETKFCYYNNYNVNQPRHFCKNCQRYWTAGGTMRNVPVGAGRRKNKNLTSQYRNISVPEALQARADLPNGIHHPALKTNGTVLTFGSDSPICESMASGLNIAEKGVRDCVQSGFQKPEDLQIPVSFGVGENREDHSGGSSVTAVNSKDIGISGLQSPVMQNSPSFPPQVPCFPGAPWPYPWNAPQWSTPGPPPAFCPPGFPMPFYPAPPFWACPIPGVLNVPWVTTLPTSQNQTALSSPTSPTLGKHSRDGTTLLSKCGDGEAEEDKSSERCLWVPKTLRIDDPEEAAKSSIWATLGIKNEKSDLLRGGGIFKAFQPEAKEKDHQSETCSVLKANPAALSRSLNFHESS